MEPNTPLSLSIAPTPDTQRIQLLDVLRGFALLGILLMNIPYFSMPYQQVYDLRLEDEFSGPNYFTFWVINGFFEGTMRSLFSILFGAGCLLLMIRLESKDSAISAADIHYRRMIWLILFGMIHAYLLQWPGDILYLYGMVGLFLFPIRNWKPKFLMRAAIILVLLLTIKDTGFMYSFRDEYRTGMELNDKQEKGDTLDKEELATLKDWKENRDKSSVDSIRVAAAKVKENVQGSWTSSLSETAPASFKFETTEAYTSLFWDALLAMLFGMWLFKTGWLTGQKSMKSYLILMVISYTIGIFLGWWQIKSLIAINFEWHLFADETYISPYHIRRILTALGHMSLLILIWKSGILKGLFNVLSAVGRMAFSNYIGQTIFCTIIFYGFGFGYFGELERYETYFVVAGIWLFQMIFSYFWLRKYQYGPLEWVWRRLTYWQKISIKKVN